MMASPPALIVIDVQQGFAEQDAAGHKRNNPEALDRIVELLAAFRARKLPIFHIRHASTEPDSVFRPERSGFQVIPPHVNCRASGDRENRQQRLHRHRP